MIPGDRITWPGGESPRIGVLVSLVEANEAPRIPSGVGRARRRYRPTSMTPRYLCREDATGLYFCPRRESVCAATMIGQQS